MSPYVCKNLQNVSFSPEEGHLKMEVFKLPALCLGYLELIQKTAVHISFCR